jgi:hypothetical protein
MPLPSKSHLARDVGIVVIGIIILFLLFVLARGLTLPLYNLPGTIDDNAPQVPDDGTEESEARAAKADRIRVTAPAEDNMLVTSPYTVRGEARGTWFFEASFPVRLVDANGNVILQHYATAQGEWMTEEFVPFTSTLTFSTPATATGWLILERDNPSGLPQYADELRIPVRFR